MEPTDHIATLGTKVSFVDIPLSYFNVAAKNVLDRLSICTAIANYIEDVAECESTIGKQLTKLGSPPLPLHRADILQGILSLWEEVFKLATIVHGKQHSSLSTTVFQYVIKPFPDHVRAIKKIVKNIFTKVNGMVEELKKAKQTHTKNLERYLKMIQDAEQSIRNRDAAVAATANELDSGDKEIAREDSFVNRSIIKMLAAAKKSQQVGEKKMTEKCKDLIHDLDAQELQLMTNSRRLGVYLTDLKHEVLKALSSLDEAERSRQLLLQEGLDKLYNAKDFLAEKLGEPLKSLADSVISIDLDFEFRDFVGQPPSIPSDDYLGRFVEKNETPGVITQILGQAEKVADMIDYMRLMSIKSSHFISEVADVERSYVKGAQKTLEKHGYSRNSSPNTSHLRTGMASPVNMSLCADVVSNLESPSMRLGWESTVRAFGGFSEIHGNTSELYQNAICQPLDVVSKQLDALRKEHLEKLSMHAKRIETAQSNHFKVSQKLIKLQQLLSERRSTLKRLKEENYQDGVTSNDLSIAQITSTPSDTASRQSFDSISGDTGNKVQSEFLTTCTNDGNNNHGSVNGNDRRGSVTMMAGLENLASASKAKISQVVKMETVADRIVRIEAKVYSLDDEEQSLMESLKAAAASLKVVYVLTLEELADLNNTIKLALTSNSKIMKDSINQFINWQSDTVQSYRSAISDVKVCCDSISLQRDMMYFVQSILTSVKSDADVHELNFLDIPVIEVFEPHRSPVIEDERRSHGIPVPIFFNGSSTKEIEEVEGAVDRVYDDSNRPSSNEILMQSEPAHINDQILLPLKNLDDLVTSLNIDGDSDNEEQFFDVTTSTSDLLSGSAMDDDVVNDCVILDQPKSLVIQSLTDNENDETTKNVDQPCMDNVHSDASISSSLSPESVLQSESAQTALLNDPLRSPALPVESDVDQLSANSIEPLSYSTRPTNLQFELINADGDEFVSRDVDKSILGAKEDSEGMVHAADTTVSVERTPQQPKISKVRRGRSSSKEGVLMAPDLSSVQVARSVNLSQALMSQSPVVYLSKDHKPQYGAVMSANSFASSLLHAATSSGATGSINNPPTPVTSQPTAAAVKDLLTQNTSAMNSRSNSTSLALSGNKDEYELTKFGLGPPGDKVIESFSCALYPKKGMLAHGRIYITQHFMAFSGWPETRVLLALQDVASIEKTNTLYYVPNAILVSTSTGPPTSEKEEYFFGSFIDRDQCYSLLTSLVKVSKRLIDLQGHASVLENRNLILGYQFPRPEVQPTISSSSDSRGALSPPRSDPRSAISPLRGASKTSEAMPSITSSPPADSAVAIQTTPQSPPTLDAAIVTNQSSYLINRNSFETTSNIPSVLVDKPLKSEPAIGEVTNSSTTHVGELKMSSVSHASPISESQSIKVLDFDDNNDSVLLSTLFKKSGVADLDSFRLPGILVSDLWHGFWINSQGYRDFLDSEGDLDIKCGEWNVLNGKVVEDITKVPFSHVRDFSYAHPRTTMLMFGPKNAPGKQKQYLYIPNKRENQLHKIDEVDDLRPRRGLVLTVTQFDGIPMADVFKVMQYWNFENDESTPGGCIVRVGVAVHFIKPSLFKSQIISGIRDELGTQAKKWFKFVNIRVKLHLERKLSSVSLYSPSILPGVATDNETALESNECIQSAIASSTPDLTNKSEQLPLKRVLRKQSFAEKSSFVAIIPTERDASLMDYSSVPTNRKVSSSVLILGLVEISIESLWITLAFCIILIILQRYQNSSLMAKLDKMTRLLESIQSAQISSHRNLVETFMKISPQSIATIPDEYFPATTLH